MLKGIDVSHWQKPVSGYVDYIEKGHTDFMVVKLTEGISFVDPEWENHIKYAMSKNMLVGLYHFARAELNEAVDEARFFVKELEKTGLLGKAVLVLDYEGEAVKFGEEWALLFLDEVFELTGVRPMIYLAQSQLKNFRILPLHNYGLWVAKWGSEPTNVNPWSFKAMWQLRGAPLDLDYFYGNREAWYKYAKSDFDEETDTEISDSYTKEIEKLVDNFLIDIRKVMEKYGVTN